MSLLEGIKVISFNHFLMGPLAAQFLADQGADVIMIESPKGSFQRTWATGDIWVGGESAMYFCANRNKRSIAVDLKSEGGREIIQKLVKDAHVVMENFRPGVMERLGFGYDAIKAVNPAIVYASASGWGSSGPYVKKPGQDLLAQAFSGLAYTCGRDRPTAASSSIVDHHGGTILAAAILGALVKQARTGEGSRVEIDLLSAAIDLQMEPLTAYMNQSDGKDTRPAGYASGWHYPAPYGIYSCKDGHVGISLGPLDEMAKALEAPELGEYEQQETWTKTAEISEIIERETGKYAVAELIDRFESAGLWISPVNDFSALAKDPQVIHNETFDSAVLASGEETTLVRHPARYNKNRPGVRIAPQPLGGQSSEILRELGYGESDIQNYIEKGIIAAAEAVDQGE
jgi:crotonobetainyl-CoA:carnitine CoA-transferase CaiB-like acyl-CoA transferase|tara:strand:+ start:1233 stop:2435 length:1203 start_codon:yes stop_codon:yes gene_type:complete